MSISTKKKRKTKSRSGRRNSNYNSAMRMLTGLTMEWSVLDPLGDADEILNSKISHTKPYARLMLTEITLAIDDVLTKMHLKWKIMVEIEFTDAFGKTYFRGADLVLWGKLNEMDGHYQKAVEEIFDVANMDQYVCTHIKSEILGNSSIKEKDFETKLDKAV